MNLQDWQAEIYLSGICPEEKLVALAIGSFGSWTVDKTVEPGMSKIAQMVSMGRETATKYRNDLVDHGYLKDTGRRGKYNTTIFELTCPEVPVTDVKKKREMSTASLENLKRRHSQVVDTVPQLEDASEPITDTLVVDTVPQLESDGTELVVEPIEALVVEPFQGKLWKESKVVVDRVPQEHIEHTNNIKEEHVSTTPNVVVDDEWLTSKELEEDTTGLKAGTDTSLNFKSETTSSISSNEGTTEAVGEVKVKSPKFKDKDFYYLVSEHEEVQEKDFEVDLIQEALLYWLDETWEKSLTWADREIEAIKAAEKDRRKKWVEEEW